MVYYFFIYLFIFSPGIVTHWECFLSNGSKLKSCYNTLNIVSDRLQELKPGGQSRSLHVLDVKHTAFLKDSLQLLTELCVHFYFIAVHVCLVHTSQSVQNKAFQRL